MRDTPDCSVCTPKDSYKCDFRQTRFCKEYPEQSYVRSIKHARVKTDEYVKASDLESDPNLYGRGVVKADKTLYESVYTGRKKQALQCLEKMIIQTDKDGRLYNVYRGVFTLINSRRYNEAIEIVKREMDWLLSLSISTDIKNKRRWIMADESKYLIEHLEELNDNLSRIRNNK